MVETINYRDIDDIVQMSGVFSIHTVSTMYGDIRRTDTIQFLETLYAKCNMCHMAHCIAVVWESNMMLMITYSFFLILGIGSHT